MKALHVFLALILFAALAGALFVPPAPVVELDFLYGSAMEAGQRLGRLAYEIQGKDIRARMSAGKPGEHHVLMTPDEYHRYGKRLLIYEQWGLDVDLRAADGLGQGRMRPAVRMSRCTSVCVVKPAPVKARAESPAAPDDEIARLIALPSVASRLAQAQKNIDARAAASCRCSTPV